MWQNKKFFIEKNASLIQIWNKLQKMFSKSPLRDTQINWRWSLSEAEVFPTSSLTLKQVIKIIQALSQFPDGYTSAQFFCKL